MARKNSLSPLKIFIILAIFTLVLLSYTSLTQRKISEKKTPEIFTPIQIEVSGARNFSAIKVPAVDSEGNGVVTLLKVETMPGLGRALVNIENLLFFVDTQFSIRIAKDVAANITGVDTSKIDLIYAIETEAELIEGTSAGAAITIATIAALQNKTLHPEVMITGTINPDGTLGLVGGIVAKAQAAKEVGVKTFLVPVGQASQATFKPVTKCEYIGNIRFCQTTYIAERTEVQIVSGIDVKEVETIQEALKYFLG